MGLRASASLLWQGPPQSGGGQSQASHSLPLTVLALGVCGRP